MTDLWNIPSTPRRSQAVTYPDLSSLLPSGELQFKQLKVCILTQDIFGPIRNGGIGTAFLHVANFLVSQGHTVTILYTLGNYCEVGKISHWVDFYAKRGIRFVAVPDCLVPDIQDPMRRQLAVARRAYEALRSMEPFDLVHVSEWSGNAYFALQAKRLGLAFEDTVFCVKTSSPHKWDLEGNQTARASLETLTLDHIEKRSVEWADIVVSPSQHMLNWMQEHAYLLPEGRTFVNPNIMPLPLNWEECLSRPKCLAKVTELVFFGRLDKRKGIDIFADALTLLKEKDALPLNITVTFLGKRSGMFDSQKSIAEWASKWRLPVKTIVDRNAEEAISYLKGEGRLAVLPSRLDNSPFTIYECLAHRIAFLTTNQGGIPELLHPEDHARIIFKPNPESLASMLRKAMCEGIPVSRASFDLIENLDRWSRFHVALAHDKSLAATAGRIQTIESEQPLVSVCLAHHNRRDLLPQALESLRRQTYRNFEVVLVDDGSTQADALAYLVSLEEEFSARNWQLVRQENRYLGAVRNASARYARGDYLLLMDDDNIAKPHELETFVRCARHSGADILTCFSDVLDILDDPSSSYCAPACITFLGDNLSAGLLMNCFGDSNALIRRGVIEEVGGFTEDYGVGHEDHEFFVRAIFRGKRLEVVPEALYWYRTVGSRMTRGGDAYKLGMQRVLRCYLEHTPAPLRGIMLLAAFQGGARPRAKSFGKKITKQIKNYCQKNIWNKTFPASLRSLFMKRS